MNRPIKFRLWDGKRMWWNVQNCYDTLECHDIESPESGELSGDDRLWFSSFGEALKSDLPIMQFTGLLDKNGKEIYEGDILVRDGYAQRDRRYIVEWSTGPGWAFFHLKKIFHKGEKPSKIEHKNYGTFWNLVNTYEGKNENLAEVIGNIYSNPELLDNAEGD